MVSLLRKRRPMELASGSSPSFPLADLVVPRKLLPQRSSWLLKRAVTCSATTWLSTAVLRLSKRPARPLVKRSSCPATLQPTLLQQVHCGEARRQEFRLDGAEAAPKPHRKAILFRNQIRSRNALIESRQHCRICRRKLAQVTIGNLLGCSNPSG